MVRGFVDRAARTAAKGLRASAEAASPPPTEEQMEDALETFTVAQWKELVKSFHLEEADAVSDYMDCDDNRPRLIRTLGAKEWRTIMAATTRHATALWLSENRSKLVPISDVYWAVALRDLALVANTKGKGHPVEGPPMDERAKAPHIARRLTKRDEQTGREMKVSRHEVGQWWKRMEELPFEQFAADRGADDEEKRGAALIDYWITIRKKYQRNK